MAKSKNFSEMGDIIEWPPSMDFLRSEENWRQIMQPPSGSRALQFHLLHDSNMKPSQGILLTQDKEWEQRKDWVVKAVNAAASTISDNKILFSQIFDRHPSYAVLFCGRDRQILYAALVNVDILNQSSSIRTWPIGDMSKKKDTNENSGPQLRPRWAEEARPKKQVKLRLEPDLISEVESAAASEGLTRNDWIEESIRKTLAAGKPKPD